MTNFIKKQRYNYVQNISEVASSDSDVGDYVIIRKLLNSTVNQNYYTTGLT
jgi:hypothetical protein